MAGETPLRPQGAVLQESLDYILGRGPDMVSAFYRKLFALDPQIAHMFDGVNLDVQKEMFLTSLHFVLMNYDRRSGIVGVLKELGARHAGYGARREHYSIVGACLLDTLKEFSGSRWSVELGLLWRTAVEHIAETMLEGAADDAPPGN